MAVPPELKDLLVNVKDAHQLMKGGQSKLFLAEWNSPGHTHHGRMVVLKQMQVQPHTDREEIWRFWLDTESPVFAKLLLGRRYEDHDFEVTEYYPKGSLLDLQRRRRSPMDPRDVHALLAQLAQALFTIGREHISHADVKPQNILVTSERPLRVVLADFGIATVIDDSTKEMASWEGTYKYAAPDREEHKLSPASDWWSLGVVILEMLMGHYPFEDILQTGGRVALRDFFTHELIEAERYLGALLNVDHRWINLVNGLLDPDSKVRWRSDEVTLWLAGQDPPVERRTPPGMMFEFRGEPARRPEDLAALMRDNWNEAGNLLLSARLSEAALWADRVSRRLNKQPVMGQRLLELAGVRPIDRAIAASLNILDPMGPAVFRTVRLDQPLRGRRWLFGSERQCRGLSELARAACDDGDGRERARALVQALWESRALRTMPGPGGDDLDEIDRDWRRVYEQARRVLGEIPEAQRAIPSEADLIPEMLLAVCDPRHVEELARFTSGVKVSWEKRRRSLPWYRRLLEEADSPGGRHFRTETLAYHVILFRLGDASIAEGQPSQQARDEARAMLSGKELAGTLDAFILAQRDGVTGGTGVTGLAASVTRRAPGAMIAVLLYAALAVAASAGIAWGADPVQGVLTGGVMLGLAAAVLAARRVRQRGTSALLGALAGGIVGLLVMAAAGWYSSVTWGAAAGWTVFWIGWMVLIIGGALWGAVE